MKDVLLSKITLIAAVGGMFLALLLGIFAGVDFVSILIRMLIAGVLLGGAALGIQLLLPKFIGDDAMKTLFPNWGGGGGEESAISDSSSSSRVDITDDSEMNADELYSGGGEPDDSPGYSGSMSGTSDEDGNSGGDKSVPPTTNKQFRELDFESDAPKVYPKDEDMGHIDHHEESGSSGSGDYVTDELNRMKERAKEGPPQETSNFTGNDATSSVFKVKNTRITADPKIIAKAIKTVMNRD
ncbi:MAG: hypothetical protein HPY53_00435 [Brevinematales bacterium]|nr:hypothetical protein [Brevinematales bacterium]